MRSLNKMCPSLMIWPCVALLALVMLGSTAAILHRSYPGLTADDARRVQEWGVRFLGPDAATNTVLSMSQALHIAQDAAQVRSELQRHLRVSAKLTAGKDGPEWSFEFDDNSDVVGDFFDVVVNDRAGAVVAVIPGE